MDKYDGYVRRISSQVADSGASSMPTVSVNGATITDSRELDGQDGMRQVIDAAAERS